MTDVAELFRQGLALDDAGRHDQAAQIYENILRIEPGNIDALHLLGLALVDLGDFARGRALLERIVMARPDNATFCFNFATIVSQLGELDTAEGYFRRAISLNPDYADAYLGLATNIKARRGDRLIDDIEALLGREGWGQHDLATLHFAAGKLFDDIGEPDRAFAHFERANAAAGRVFDRDAHRNLVLSHRQVFTDELFARLSDSGSQSAAMIFVVGMPRSGTTLVEQIIGSHPEVYPVGERRDVAVISGILPRLDPSGRGFPECVPHIAPEAFRAFAERYLKVLLDKAGTAARIVDKNPLNFYMLGLIALLFPRARIIHCRRDPVDTCLSCYFQFFQPDLDFAFDLGDLASVYCEYRKLMAHWNEHLPLPILDVDYEALVADFESQTRRMIEFCGLPWDEACLDYRSRPGRVPTASKWQVRQAIYASSVGRAQSYHAHLGPLLRGLDPFLGPEWKPADPATG